MKQIIYTASSESQQIHAWRLNDEGSLTLIQTVYVPGQVCPILISSDNRFLYAGVRHKFRILTYYIEPEDGILTLTGEISLPCSPTHISTDHQGKFLFISSYSSDCVNVMKVRDGIPLKIVDAVGGLKGCHSSNLSPDGHTLWVLALKQDCIFLFTISKRGKLIAQTPSKIKTVKGSGPRHMVFHPNKQYAYVINELVSSIDVWKLKDVHGEITHVQVLDMIPNGFYGTRWASDIHITPDGHHLYACDRTANLITIFSVSEDGSSLKIEGFQPTEMQPRGFNIDHSGKYLISAGQKSHYITLYKIHSAQGLLEKRDRHAVGRGPVWIVISAH